MADTSMSERSNHSSLITDRESLIVESLIVESLILESWNRGSSRMRPMRHQCQLRVVQRFADSRIRGLGIQDQ